MRYTYFFFFFGNGLIDDVIVIGWTDSDFKISRALIYIYIYTELRVLISYIVRCFREENFYFSLLPAISDSSYVLKYVYNSVNACWPMHQGMLNMAVPCCVVSRDSVSVLKPSIWLVCIFYVNTCFITLRASWKISCCMLNVVTLFK